jgi:hypothetical protein
VGCSRSTQEYLVAPTELVKRINLGQLWPPFLERVLELIAKARDAGKDYYLVSGFRSYEEQAGKYALGRTKIGKRITNAQPGFSLHQYGIGVDCALDKDISAKGLQPEWENNEGQYDLLRDSALGTGLQVGVPTVPGGDPGHIQPSVVTVFGVQEMSLLVKLRGIYLRNRDIHECWKELDRMAAQHREW